MSASPDSDLLRFRRTFTLLIVLVVLPSAGLSGFGVVAIVNERAAVEKRLESAWGVRLETLARSLLTALAEASFPADGPSSVLSTRQLVLSGVAFQVQDGQVTTNDRRLGLALSGIAAELPSFPERPVVFSIADAQGAILVAAQRQGPRVAGVQLADSALAELLRQLGAAVTPPGELVRFSLQPVKREPTESLIARLSQVREAALGPRELGGLVLPAPLQDFRLVVWAEGEDPVAQASARNRAVYAVLLGLFYVTLAVGVVFTGRTLYREARLSRLKTDFVSLVSHELRTPLTSIRMFIEMLAMGRVKEPGEMQTVLDLLSKETARLSAMIENVLDWARIESLSKHYQRAPTSVRTVVNIAVEAMRAQRVGEPLQLHLDVPEGLPDLDLDRDAVAGALLNLLQNAYKYTGPDKRIELRARNDGAGVVLEVEDNGVGIPRRELSRIFERFYRVDSLLARTTQGSGLGLSIAERIVRAHGGRITVESTVGRGSVFRVHLPGRRA